MGSLIAFVRFRGVKYHIARRGLKRGRIPLASDHCRAVKEPGWARRYSGLCYTRQDPQDIARYGTFAVGQSTWTPMEEQPRVIQLASRPENVARVVQCSTSPQKRGQPHVQQLSGTVCAADRWVPAGGRDTHKEEPGNPTSRDMELRYDPTVASGGG